MSKVSDAVLERLIACLPLSQRKAQLSSELQKVHSAILRSLVERGRPLNKQEIAYIAPHKDAVSAIWTLAANDLIVVDHEGNPVGAYPVTTMETPHRVTVDGNEIWAMCAFDAVAVAPLFETDVHIRSRCPMTGAAIDIEQGASKVVRAEPSPAIQIGVWWRDPGVVAAKNFCPGITFLRDPAAAAKWQGKDTVNHTFAGLEDAIDAARRFFGPLLKVG